MGALQDERKRARRTAYTVALICCMSSAGWVTVGYIWGRKADDVRYEQLQARQAVALEKLRTKYEKQMSEQRRENSATVGTIANAASDTAKAAQALIDANDKPKKGK
jgi:hypothetical protein